MKHVLNSAVVPKRRRQPAFAALSADAKPFAGLTY